MMWELRERFPIHLIAFKQTSCHLSHEDNVEQVLLSRAGNLSETLTPIWTPSTLIICSWSG
jgi:hypothetical protein